MKYILLQNFKRLIVYDYMSFLNETFNFFLSYFTYLYFVIFFNTNKNLYLKYIYDIYKQNISIECT